MIYYHFRGKDDLFTQILQEVFSEYFTRLETLQTWEGTQFDRIQRLIELHFQFVDEKPSEIYLAFSACPAKLNDPDHLCARKVQRQRKMLKQFLVDCLEQGIGSGEFQDIEIEATAHLLMALIHGLLRLRGLKIDNREGMQTVTVDFIRRALLKMPV